MTDTPNSNSTESNIIHVIGIVFGAICLTLLLSSIFSQCHAPKHAQETMPTISATASTASTASTTTTATSTAN